GGAQLVQLSDSRRRMCRHACGRPRIYSRASSDDRSSQGRRDDPNVGRSEMRRMPLDTPSAAAVVPPMPPMASDRSGALRVLLGVGRNAYSAFPRRCLDEPIVNLRLAGRHLVLASSPDAIRHIMITAGEDYVRLPLGRRVLGPIVGRGLLGSEGETRRRQRRAMAPALTPRNLPMMARHIVRCAGAACDRLGRARGTEVDLLDELQMLSLEIAATSLFSLEASTFGP